jgi:hypothetical protein
MAASSLPRLSQLLVALSSGSTPTSQVLTNICHMLLNTNEFLYVD